MQLYDRVRKTQSRLQLFGAERSQIHQASAIRQQFSRADQDPLLADHMLCQLT